MEIIDLDEENKIILEENCIFIQRKSFKKDFPRRDFLYFLAAWVFILIVLNFILGFSLETVLICFFISFIFILPIVSYYQTAELEINFKESLIKHRYIFFEWKFREKTLLNQLEYVSYRLLPGELLSNDDNVINSYELTARKHHYPHVDLFYFLNKDTALKLVPIFKEKFGIEVAEELDNFRYLK